MARRKFIILDNFDSFTYNLYQQFLVVTNCNTDDLLVLRNNQLSATEIERLSPSGVIISPGPGGPADTGVCGEVIKLLYTRVPILGICLGHQLIAHLFGARVIKAPKPVHGKTSPILHTAKGLFEGLPSPFKAARYHSLVVDFATLDSNFYIDAKSEDGMIMAIRHKTYKLFGIQFHPESFLSTMGDRIIFNYYSACNAERDTSPGL